MVTASDLSDVGTVKQVRLTLGNPADGVYDQAVIERGLESARVVVANLANNASDAELREAVVSTAAYRTANSSPMSTQKEAAGVSKEVEVAEYLARLKTMKDDTLDDVEGARATFEVF